jgi:hypothetical protein
MIGIELKIRLRAALSFVWRLPSMDQTGKSSMRAYVFRVAPESGLKSDIAPCPKMPEDDIRLCQSFRFIDVVPGDRDDSNRAWEALVTTFRIAITDCSN